VATNRFEGELEAVLVSVAPLHMPQWDSPHKRLDRRLCNQSGPGLFTFSLHILPDLSSEITVIANKAKDWWRKYFTGSHRKNPSLDLGRSFKACKDLQIVHGFAATATVVQLRTVGFAKTKHPTCKPTHGPALHDQVSETPAPARLAKRSSPPPPVPAPGSHAAHKHQRRKG
jgi:hypothetical protein